jgi:transcriptional regulator with XRE-family HTH domain
MRTKPSSFRHIDENYIREVFSWNLRKRLNDKKLSLQGLAEKMGTSPTVVSAWANGRKSPQPRMLAGICNILECTPDYLMRDYYAS